MIFVQKLPTLEPEMKGALRSHIIRKRQRLKQELEQDAIEKRLKREKELKQLQDAMTLDQIKEQLSVLEKKLETLRDEKHNLFVQLKQVLNEDNSRRKQQKSEDQKNQQSGETDSSTTPSISNNNLNQTPVSIPSTVATSSNLKQPYPTIPSTAPKVESSPIPPTQLPAAARQTPPRIPPISATRLNQLPYAVHSSSYLGSPILPPIPLSTYSAQQSNLSRQSLGAAKPINPELHVSPSRASLLSGPMPELMPPSPLTFGHHQQRMQSTQLTSRPYQIDIPMGLETNNQHDLKMSPVGVKRSLSVASLNEPLDERSLARKRPNSFMYSNPNQFLNDGVSHGLPSLSRYNSLNHPLGLPISSIGTSVPSSTPDLMHNNLIPKKSLPHQPLTNFDYMINSGKPGVMMPGLNSFYSTHPSLIPQTSLYPGIEGDLKHFASPYYSQYSNTSRHNNLPLLQTEHNPQYLAASMNYNAARKPPHSKNSKK